MPPIVSIIIPVHNREFLVESSVQSALNQTYQDFEIIIVDDGSTDGTYGVIAALASKDRRIRCMRHTCKSGAQAARNCGILEARGDWIAFLDSDDEWLPRKLEKQVNMLAENGFNHWIVVHTNAVWIDTTTGKRFNEEVPAVEGANVYPRLLAKPGPLFPGMLVSRTALEKISYLDENVPSFQEWDTSIRLAKHCRFIFMREPLFIYNLHSGETISKNKKTNITGYQYIIDKFEREIKDVCGIAVWESHLIKQLTNCLNYGLWLESDRYYPMISHRDLIFSILQICRALHLRPSKLNAVKKIFYPDKQRIPAR